MLNFLLVALLAFAQTPGLSEGDKWAAEVVGGQIVVKGEVTVDNPGIEVVVNQVTAKRVLSEGDADVLVLNYSFKQLKGNWDQHSARKEVSFKTPATGRYRKVRIQNSYNWVTVTLDLRKE